MKCVTQMIYHVQELPLPLLASPASGSLLTPDNKFKLRKKNCRCSCLSLPRLAHLGEMGGMGRADLRGLGEPLRGGGPSLGSSTELRTLM